jgi:hypothetical protein
MADKVRQPIVGNERAEPPFSNDFKRQRRDRADCPEAVRLVARQSAASKAEPSTRQDDALETLETDQPAGDNSNRPARDCANDAQDPICPPDRFRHLARAFEPLRQLPYV